MTEVDIVMSRTDIADHLGLTIETVSRAFTKLRRQGIIALPHPQRLEILDVDALRELADCACTC
jgi:CRP/FNR family transcriptional regulator